MGSSVFTLLVSGGVSVVGLEDTDGIFSLCRDENPGLLLDLRHHRRHREKGCRLNVMVHCQLACREAFAFDGLGGNIGYDVSEDTRHSGGFGNP